MRLRIVSRSSDLAVLQATFVKHTLQAHWPDLDVSMMTQSTQGDRDQRVALWDTSDKGLFTQDLSRLLVEGKAEAVVHSWKDLPIAGPPGTTIAGTLARADPRDVLLLRQSVVRSEPDSLTVLSSSPRRVWQMQQSLPPLLPWTCASIDPLPVRGNIRTRVQKLLARQADGLIVAKAALDRLLSPLAGPEVSTALRAALARCAWMVLPLEHFPTAAAQGALAVEVSSERDDVRQRVEAISHPATRQAVEAERAILASHGGGCHEAIGATILLREYGRVTSVRGRLPQGEVLAQWSLSPLHADCVQPRADEAHVWPRRDERGESLRQALPIGIPADADALWVTRADALPEQGRPMPSTLVWTAGVRTWEKLAARGVWCMGAPTASATSSRPTSICWRAALRGGGG